MNPPLLAAAGQPRQSPTLIPCENRIPCENTGAAFSKKPLPLYHIYPFSKILSFVNALVECHQRIAGVDGCALSNRNGCNGAVCRCCDLVLHLHSLENQNDLACCDCCAFCDLDVENGSRHRGGQGRAAACCRWSRSCLRCRCRSCLRCCRRCRCCCWSRCYRCCRCRRNTAHFFHFYCVCLSVYGDIVLFHFDHSFRFIESFPVYGYYLPAGLFISLFITSLVLIRAFSAEFSQGV